MALTKVDISIMDNVGTTANKLLAYGTESGAAGTEY